MARKRKPTLRTGPLSPGQREVFLAVEEGRSLSDIAADRGVAVGTVENQLYVACSKLTVPRHDVPGCTARLDDRQRALIWPEEKRRGVRQKNQPPHGHLTPAELASYTALEAGATVPKAAAARGVAWVTVEMQAASACRKLGVPFKDVAGSRALLAPWQEALLVPRPKPLGRRANDARRVPGNCPCCGQPWPADPRLAGPAAVEAPVADMGTPMTEDEPGLFE